MRLLYSQKFQWRNASHQGLSSVCTIRVFATEGMGPAIIITEAGESQGPPIVQVLECLVALVEGLPEIQALLGYSEFDDAMWFFGTITPMGPMFLRIREQPSDGTFTLDSRNAVFAGAMDELIGPVLPGVVETFIELRRTRTE